MQAKQHYLQASTNYTWRHISSESMQKVAGHKTRQIQSFIDKTNSSTPMFPSERPAMPRYRLLALLVLFHGYIKQKLIDLNLISSPFDVAVCVTIMKIDQ